MAVAQLARQREPVGADRPDAALALDRLDQHGAGARPDRARRARPGRREARASKPAGHAVERLALRGSTSPPRASRACGRGRRPRRTRSRAWPGPGARARRRASLMAASTASAPELQKNAALERRRARPGARQAPPAARSSTGSRRGRGMAACSGERLRSGRDGRGRASSRRGRRRDRGRRCPPRPRPCSRPRARARAAARGRSASTAASARSCRLTVRPPYRRAPIRTLVRRRARTRRGAGLELRQHAPARARRNPARELRCAGSGRPASSSTPWHVGEEDELVGAQRRGDAGRGVVGVDVEQHAVGRSVASGAMSGTRPASSARGPVPPRRARMGSPTSPSCGTRRAWIALPRAAVGIEARRRPVPRRARRESGEALATTHAIVGRVGDAAAALEARLDAAPAHQGADLRAAAVHDDHARPAGVRLRPGRLRARPRRLRASRPVSGS